MKIVSWNCNGGLRNKLATIDALNADLLIIQECENPEFHRNPYKEWAGDYLWVGTDKNKGIGIFPKNGNAVNALDWNGSFKIGSIKHAHPYQEWKTTDLKLFLPFRVNDEFNMLGVWTKGTRDEAFSYIGQFWKYLQIHREDLTADETVIVGDFNSNKRWDKSDRWWNHSVVVSELEQLGLYSLYHYRKNEAQGFESIPTFYLYRNMEKAYHIDYAFISKSLIINCEIEIGRVEDWLSISDHLPIIIKMEKNNGK
ncbi:MAG: endonuclease/exonuclease/phosphatase family protein [Gammaproteobacteria bacterium]|nr:endonuclease/exonuclease/phosphatase family protein [Gammaproteobacteria bacterium]